MRAGQTKYGAQGRVDENKVRKGWEREPRGGHVHVSEHRKRSSDTETRQPCCRRAVWRGLLKKRIPLLGSSGVPKGILHG